MSDNMSDSEKELVGVGINRAAKHHGLLKVRSGHIFLDTEKIIAAAAKDPLGYLTGKSVEQNIEGGTASVTDVARCEKSPACTAGMIAGYSESQGSNVDKYEKNVVKKADSSATGIHQPSF